MNGWVEEGIWELTLKIWKEKLLLTMNVILMHLTLEELNANGNAYSPSELLNFLFTWGEKKPDTQPWRS